MTDDGRGGALIVWQQSSRMVAQHLDRLGQFPDGWTPARGIDVSPSAPSGAFMQSNPRVARDESGGAYVLWHDRRRFDCQGSCEPEPRELFVERLGGDGTIAPGWPDAGLAVGSSLGRMTGIGDNDGLPTDLNGKIAADSRGGAIVVWEELPLFSGDSTATIRAQRVSPDGALLWGSRGFAVCSVNSVHAYPAVVADGTGGAIVVWQDDRESPGHTRLFGQRVSARGAALWAANGITVTRAARTDERAHVLAADGNGGAYVAWEASALRTPTAVFIQRVDKAGRATWPADVPVARSGGGQGMPALTTDEKGDAWLAWIDSRTIHSVDVYAQRLSRAGAPEPGWPDSGAAVCAVPSRQRARPRIVTAGAEGAYIVWLEDLAPRAARITRLGVVPASWPAGGAQLSDSPFADGHFALAPADRGRAIVSWSEGRPPTAAASLVRAQLLSPDGAGTPASPQPRRALPASVTPGPGVEFALRGFQPNPASDVLAVAFALPDDAPARLEVFDVAGRRCAVQEVGPLGAGTHVVTVVGGRAWAAGFYFVRLTRGDVVLSSRGLVVR